LPLGGGGDDPARLARAKFGTGYSYYVIGVSPGRQVSHIYADVTGYSRDKVFDASVDWQK
jgi:hypothetical protein